MAASGSDQAPDAGQPGTGPDEPVLDAKRAAGLPPQTAHGARPAGRADTAPFATPARHIDASAPGKAPPGPPPGARTKSEAQKNTPDMPQRAADRETSPGGHNRDKDSFDALMESCGSDPHADPARAAPLVRREPRRDHTEGTPLMLSCRAHLQRNYTALGKTEHAAVTDDVPVTANGAAD